MKWYNKDKTKMFDLSLVAGWKYSAAASTVLSKLWILIGGREIILYGDEADEVLSVLVFQKEVI